MKNPFEFGRELGADELVDRTDELRTVLAAIRNGSVLWVIGRRRLGKSSLLASAEERAGKGAIVLRYDAEAFPTIEHLAERILTDTAKRVATTFEKTRQAALTFFASVRPEVRAESDGSIAVRLTGKAGRSGGIPLGGVRQ